LTSAEWGRAARSLRPGRGELAQRVDIGAKQRPGREPGSRRIGRPVKLERARVRDVGNQHGELSGARRHRHAGDRPRAIREGGAGVDAIGWCSGR
jgi:hypothetical protein